MTTMEQMKKQTDDLNKQADKALVDGDTESYREIVDQIINIQNQIYDTEVKIESMFADIGTVSHGTMRTQDLIPLFLSTIHEVDPKKYNALVDVAEELDAPIGSAYLSKGCTRGIDACDDHEWWTSDNAIEFLNEDLWDQMNLIAPPYTCFGSHEGDGSDYGFWVDSEYIKEMIYEGSVKSVSDLSEIDEGYEGDVCIVNDHGNMTMGYHRNGELIKTYWAIV